MFQVWKRCMIFTFGRSAPENTPLAATSSLSSRSSHSMQRPTFVAENTKSIILPFKSRVSMITLTLSNAKTIFIEEAASFFQELLFTATF